MAAAWAIRPGCQENSVPFHTNATQVSDWEVFEMVPLTPMQDKFALKTFNGSYVTALNGGGVGDPAGQPFNSAPIHTDATQASTWETFEVGLAEAPNRRRSLLSDVQAYAPLATHLIGVFGDFQAANSGNMQALTGAVNGKTLNAATVNALRSMAQSAFVQSARSAWQQSATISFAFSGSGGVILGGALAAGIAFDWSFSRYMFYETLSGSFGATVGASVDFRLGLYDYDVFSFNGFSDSVEFSLGAGVGGAVAGNYNWWDGPGIEFAFGAGIEASLAGTLGYSFDSGHGTL